MLHRTMSSKNTLLKALPVCVKTGKSAKTLCKTLGIPGDTRR